jgi:RNA polymerase sigma-70 factor (ECF subfamily)
MTSSSESTCWTTIRGAAAGHADDRDALARRYLDVVRSYLSARWHGSTLSADIDDATQAVFVECFREGGVLHVAESGRVTSFRAFLFGVVRNVARRFESRRVRAGALPSDLVANEESQSRLFDRTWAKSLMAEAAQLQRQRAHEQGDEAVRRIELLRLRFEEGLPIRTIAERRGVSAAALHHDYALARKEFKAILLEVVAFHHPGTRAEIEQEAAGLLKALALG